MAAVLWASGFVWFVSRLCRVNRALVNRLPFKGRNFFLCYGMQQLAVSGLIGLAFYICPSPVFAEQAVADKFRKVIADIEARCKRQKRGPYLDRSDPEYRKKVADTSCDILKLQPRDWRDAKMVKLDSQPYPIPELWLATQEGRFAHSIKLPSPYDKPKTLYRPTMTSEEYFNVLCKEEAGDFVLRSVKNVEGIARHRRPEVATDDLLRHLFATEGTAAIALWHISVGGDDIGRVLVQPNHGKYSFVEARAFPKTIEKDGFPFRRFSRDPAHATGTAISYRPDGSTYSVRNEVVEKGVDRPMARYGFTWRGITRLNDREMGIAGGELIVLDLETSEVLGFRRIFRATTIGTLGAWWLTAANCSKELATLPSDFIYRVLRPRE